MMMEDDDHADEEAERCGEMIWKREQGRRGGGGVRSITAVLMSMTKSGVRMMRRVRATSAAKWGQMQGGRDKARRLTMPSREREEREMERDDFGWTIAEEEDTLAVRKVDRPWPWRPC